MKKILFVALAAVGLTACVQNEELSVPQSDAIAFGNAYLDNAVRGAEDPSTTTNTISNFNVWGFMDTNAGTVFTAQDVEKKNGVWGYNGTQYWMPEHLYHFSALSPMDSQNWQIGTATIDGIYGVQFTNVDGTEDLLYATEEVSTAGKTLTSTYEVVTLPFQHILSKVKFTFTNGFGTNNMYVQVSDVKMTAPAAGTIDLDGEFDNYKGNWTLGAGAVELAFGDVEKLAMGTNAEVAAERFTIPATADYTYNVTFHVTVYAGDEVALEVDKTATIAGYALEMGKAYNFTAEINPDNLGLAPIEFDASVVDWVPAGDVPVANGSQVSTEAELAAAFAQGGEYALAGDITVTAPLTVPAGKTVILDLYSYTLSGEGATQGESLIVNNGTLKLVNTAATRNAVVGTVTYKFVGQNDPNYGKGNYTITNCGTLEVANGVVIENTTAAMSHAYYAIDNNSGPRPTTLILKEGSKVVNETSHAIRLFVNGKKNTVLTEGEIVGWSRAMWIQLPSSNASVAPEVLVDIKGGSLTVANPEDAYQLAIYSYTAGNDLKNVKINVYEGATINGHIALTGGNNKNSVETVNVSGGTFNVRTEYGAIYSYGDETLAAQAINIYNGTFNTEPYAYTLADGFSAAKDGENWVIVAGEGDVVVHSADALTAALAASNVEKIVLAEGEYGTIVMKSNKTIVAKAGAKVDCVNLNGAANVTLKNIVFDAANAVPCVDGAGTYKLYANIITGAWQQTQATKGSWNCVIDGCKFEGTFKSGKPGAAIAFTDQKRTSGASGNITIKNCTFNTVSDYGGYDIYGFYCGNGQNGYGDFVIENNVFKTSFVNGCPVYLGKYASSTPVVVKGNTFETATSLAAAVYVQDHSNYGVSVDASNNTFAN